MPRRRHFAGKPPARHKASPRQADSFQHTTRPRSVPAHTTAHPLPNRSSNQRRGRVDRVAVQSRLSGRRRQCRRRRYVPQRARSGRIPAIILFRSLFGDGRLSALSATVAPRARHRGHAHGDCARNPTRSYDPVASVVRPACRSPGATRIVAAMGCERRPGCRSGAARPGSLGTAWILVDLSVAALVQHPAHPSDQLS